MLLPLVDLDLVEAFAGLRVGQRQCSRSCLILHSLSEHTQLMSFEELKEETSLQQDLEPDGTAGEGRSKTALAFLVAVEDQISRRGEAIIRSPL